MTDYNDGYRLIYQLMRTITPTLTISERTVRECINETAKLLTIDPPSVVTRLVEYYTSQTKPLIEVYSNTWEPISQKVYRALADKGWIVKSEIGRGSETLVLEVHSENVQAVALISFPVDPGPDMSGTEMVRHLQTAYDISNIFIKIYDVIECSGIYDNPKYKTQNEIYVVEKMQTTLDVYLRSFRDLPYTTRFVLAYDMLKKIYKTSKALTRLGYWHSDLQCSNIGINFDVRGNIDIKFIDLNSVAKISAGMHARDIELAYYDVLILLDMVEVTYDDSTPFPIITKWKGKRLYLSDLA